MTFVDFVGYFLFCIWIDVGDWCGSFQVLGFNGVVKIVD